MATSDGQSFWDQSGQTIADFQAVYGNDAEAAWEAEHEARISGNQNNNQNNNNQNNSNNNAAPGSDSWWEQFQKDLINATTQAAGSGRDEMAARLEIAKRQIDGQWRVAKLQAKTQAESLAVDRWYKGEQIKLATLAHDLDAQRVQNDIARVGIEQQNANTNLVNAYTNQGQLGLGYLKTAADYASTPGNYFAGLDFASGAQQRQDVPIFLQQLANNVNGPSWQPPGGTPIPNSISALSQGLGGPGLGGGGGAPSGWQAPTSWSPPASGGGQVGTPVIRGETGTRDPSQYTGNGITEGAGDARVQAAQAITSANPPSNTVGWTPQDVAALRAIGNVYAKGGGSLGAQALEGLGATGNALLDSGGRRLGYDPSLFKQAYVRSRVSQGAAGAA